MLPSALAYTRTHTLSHSRSLRVSVFISFHIKTHLPQMSVIIEIQDSIVFGCSHFIKVALTQNNATVKSVKIVIFIITSLLLNTSKNQEIIHSNGKRNYKISTILLKSGKSCKLTVLKINIHVF